MDPKTAAIRCFIHLSDAFGKASEVTPTDAARAWAACSRVAESDSAVPCLITFAHCFAEAWGVTEREAARMVVEALPR